MDLASSSQIIKPLSPAPSPAVIAARFVRYQSMFWWFLLIIVVAGFLVAHLFQLSRAAMSSRRRKVVGG
jgi:hypothetical protein